MKLLRSFPRLASSPLPGQALQCRADQAPRPDGLQRLIEDMELLVAHRPPIGDAAPTGNNVIDRIGMDQMEASVAPPG